MTFAENIMDTLATADDSQWMRGLSWYRTAHLLAVEISPDDVLKGAGIIAAYSIQNSWNRNVTLARQTMATGEPAPHTGMVKGKARRILDGESPISVLGPKTSAFAATIFDDSTDLVVVDRHARDIAFGAPQFKNPSIGKRLYAEIADAYRFVASAVSLYPSQVQAITWVAWRDGKNLAWAD